MFMEGMQSIIDNTNEVITTLGEGYVLANKLYGYLGEFNPFKKKNTKELNVNKENDIVKNQYSELNYLEKYNLTRCAS